MKGKKNIGILTSSRADFGIYLPLLEEIRKCQELDLSIIAFGTHLSPYHGLTKDYIESQGFEVQHMVNSMLLHDDENAIATAVSLTMMKFSEFWMNNCEDFDLVFCLGDRFEMFGAVYAGVPFGVRFAHIHGGETTLGAIDNTYRHAISLASQLHFVATEENRTKVKELTESNDIYVSGSLSLHNKVNLFSVDEMRMKFAIDFSKPTILVTVHPETVDIASNERFADICFKSIKKLQSKYQIVITMPNVDTQGSVFRKAFKRLQSIYDQNIILIESFGTQGYFTAMHLSKFLIGNTSSGIIEAASFRKYVVNLGDRQKGRSRSDNVLDCPFDVNSIVEKVEVIELMNFDYAGENIYYKANGIGVVLNQLRDL